MIQSDLFKPSLAQQFEEWKATPAGGFVLQQAYRLAAGQAARFDRSGHRGSVALIWEVLRDRVGFMQAMAKKRKVKLTQWRGFTLNNNLRPYVARHILERRPEWKGLFDVREVGKERKKRRVLVIEEAA